MGTYPWIYLGIEHVQNIDSSCQCKNNSLDIPWERHYTLITTWGRITILSLEKSVSCPFPWWASRSIIITLKMFLEYKNKTDAATFKENISKWSITKNLHWNCTLPWYIQSDICKLYAKRDVCISTKSTSLFSRTMMKPSSYIDGPSSLLCKLCCQNSASYL